MMIVLKDDALFVCDVIYKEDLSLVCEMKLMVCFSFRKQKLGVFKR